MFRMAKHAYFEVQPIPEITDAIEKFIGMCAIAVPVEAFANLA